MAHMNELYPWQINDFARLQQIRKKFPSSILFMGQVGTGVYNLAYNFIAGILCENVTQNGIACGSCNSCILLQQHNHPDLLFVHSDSPDDVKNKSISVGVIRGVIEFASISTHIASKKIIFIENANLLNQNSANALLKILEEPAPYILFVLISNNVEQLLPTLRSRCYKFAVARSNRELSLAYLSDKAIENTEFWLDYYQNSPLFEVSVTSAQLELLILTLTKPSIENIFKLAEVYDGKTISFSFFVEFMLKWIVSLAMFYRMQTSQSQLPKLFDNADCFSIYLDDIIPLLSKLQEPKLYYFFDRLNFFSEWVSHSLHQRSQIENLLFQYQQIFTKD